MAKDTSAFAYFIVTLFFYSLGVQEKYLFSLIAKMAFILWFFVI